MRKDNPCKLSVGKRIMYNLLDAAGAIIGGLSFFLCCYWFFHYETWHERLISIGLTVLAVYVLAKLIPERPNQ